MSEAKTAAQCLEFAAEMANAGDLREALLSLNEALRLDPASAEAFFQRAVVRARLAQDDLALEDFARSAELNPQQPFAHYNQGIALMKLHRVEEALVCFGRTIKLQPDHASWYNGIGVAFAKLKRFQQAIQSFDYAIRLNPSNLEFYSNRGNVYLNLHQYQKAIDDFLFCRKHNAQSSELVGRLFVAMSCMANWEEREPIRAEIIAAIESDPKPGDKPMLSFDLLAIDGKPWRQLRAAQLYAREKMPYLAAKIPPPPAPQQRKIRVGYYSSDFRNHPVSYLTAELFARHDRERFEVHGFSYGTHPPDEMRQTIATAVDYFHEVSRVADHEVLQLSRQIGIDIAVDLNGFTEDGRTELFAQRVAPVQVNMLGYPATMGVEFIDYLIADKTVVPAEYREFYAEKIVFMPNSFQANDSTQLIADSPFTRENCQLPSTGFVYCCFNSTPKITPRFFDCWMRILKQVEGSVLWLVGPNESVILNLRNEASQRGVDPARLVFAQTIPLAQHMRRQQLGDLFLDTLPFGAGATASPALWSGLPILTALGESFCGRMAASLLRAVGMPELVTEDLDSYERLAVEIGRTPGRSEALRQKLSEQLSTAPLFNTLQYTRDLEAAYFRMVDRASQQLPPEDIWL